MSKAVELLLRLGHAMTRVAEELLLDGGPCPVHRIARLDDGPKNVGGDHGIKPGDDRCIDLQLGNIIVLELDVDGAIDVVQEAELVERNVEEGTPCGVVRGIKIKNHGNMGLDVDELRGGGGDRFRFRSTKGLVRSEPVGDAMRKEERSSGIWRRGSELCGN